MNLVVKPTISLAVVAALSMVGAQANANALTWYSWQPQLQLQSHPQQFPTIPTPINHFHLQFPFSFSFNQQFPSIIIPPITFPNQFPFNDQPLIIHFPNQFPFNFNGHPIPIPPIPPIQSPQQQSVSQNTQCNNGSCTTFICTNGACQTQTSTGSTVSVTTQCINGICTTTYH